MFCSNCGVKNKEDAVFCIDCGEKVHQNVDASGENKKGVVNTDYKSTKKRSPVQYLLMVISFLVGASLVYVTTIIYQDTSQVLPINAVDSQIASRSHTARQLSNTSSITCTYPQFLNANYAESQINHELNKPETKPIIITFTDLTEDMATLLFIDSTQTVSEVSAAKVYEDNQKIVLIEGLNGVYTTLHTIFLDKALAVNSKQMDIFGISISAGTSIGHCR